jgi:hypothetical protein
MIYEFTITTPANTLESSRKKTTLKLEAGMITDLKILFPPGCAGLHYLQIHRGGHQVFPKQLNYFRGDNVLLDFPSPEYPMYSPPFELDAYTWNLDDTYEHSVDIYIEITRKGTFVE